MSESSTEATGTADSSAQRTEGEAGQQGTTEDSTDWKAEARKWEQRAKENKQAASELEKQRKASMTEAERAVAEAEARGRTAAASEFGKRLARTEFDAQAGRRNPDFDTNAALEYVDLARFVGDDGEPDAKAIKAAVERLVPEAGVRTTSYDGGARSTAAKGGDMNSVIRKAAGYAG